MKKTFILLCLALCGCRSLPADTFMFETDQKNENYRYELDASSPYYLRSGVEQALKTRGQKIGKVVISDQKVTSGSGDNVLWLTPSVLTLGIINLVGWPAYHASETSRVTAKVYNTSNQLVDSYTAYDSDWSFAACYYGFEMGDSMQRAYSGAYKKALNKVLKQIKDDDELYNILKGRADKEVAERRKREAEKKKHLDNVMSDLENL